MTWLEPWRTQTREDPINSINEWRKGWATRGAERPVVTNQARYLRQYFRRGPVVRHGSPEQYIKTRVRVFRSRRSNGTL